MYASEDVFSVAIQHKMEFLIFTMVTHCKCSALGAKYGILIAQYTYNTRCIRTYAFGTTFHGDWNTYDETLYYLILFSLFFQCVFSKIQNFVLEIFTLAIKSLQRQMCTRSPTSVYFLTD